MITITIKCHECLQHNSRIVWKIGEEPRSSTFTNFTDAFNHQKDFPSHKLEFEIRDDREDYEE